MAVVDLQSYRITYFQKTTKLSFCRVWMAMHYCSVLLVKLSYGRYHRYRNLLYILVLRLVDRKGSTRLIHHLDSLPAH